MPTKLQEFRIRVEYAKTSILRDEEAKDDKKLYAYRLMLKACCLSVTFPNNADHIAAALHEIMVELGYITEES